MKQSLKIHSNSEFSKSQIIEAINYMLVESALDI